MKVNICLDPTSYKTKPKEEAGKITNRIGKYARNIEIHEAAVAIANGRTFTPAIFRGGHRDKVSVEEIQLFPLDFDNGYPYEDVRDKLKKYGLPIAFSYHTFNSEPDYPKYRIVLCHIVPIREIWVMDLIFDILKKMFPEADEKCFERARMLFGGKGLIEYNDNAVFRIDRLIEEFQRYEYTKNSHNATSEIRRIASRYHIALEAEKYLYVRTYEGNVTVSTTTQQTDQENGFSDDKYIMSLNPNSSESYPKVVFTKAINGSESCSKDKKDKRITLQHVDISTLRDTCRLFSSFLNNEEDLTHEEHMLLALNLISIKGMKEVFFNCLENAGCDIEKWNYDWKFFKDKNYQPMCCEGNCRYEDECNHKANILLTLKSRDRVIKRVTEPDYVSIEESYSIMSNYLQEELTSPGSNNIVLIPGQTGIGKTHAYIEALKSIDTPVIIAVPTVDLKHEVAEKARGLAVAVPSFKDLSIPYMKAMEIQEIYDSGHFKEAREKLKEFKNELPDYYVALHDEIDRYLEGTAVIEEQKNNYIITHSQLFHIKTDAIKNYTVIVDEDILFTIMRNTKTIEKTSVEKAIENGFIPEHLADDLQEIIKSNDCGYIRLNNKDPCASYYSIEEQNKGGCRGNLNDLLLAGAACIDNDYIHYFTPSRLPRTKIIVMSATLSEDLYKLYFPDRNIIKHEVPMVRYKGRLIQNVSHSMSRTDMDKLIKEHGTFKVVEDMIFKAVNDKVEYEISFKKYIRECSLSCKMNYGATLGIDEYNGQNGLIIGTPHLDEKSYKLVACYMGIDVSNSHLASRRIRHKGYDFRMMTYKEDVLRKLQLYLLDSELEQAIGRSRLLRNDCKVYLFSNFPCEQAELVTDDFLIEKSSDTLQKDISET